ncbi:MAG: metallophosphoesterase [Paludibacter sp.]
MRMYMLTLVSLLLLIAIPDTFFYLKLKRKDSHPFYIVLHLIPALVFAGLFMYIKLGLESMHNFRIVVAVMWLFFFFLLIYLSKLIHAFFYVLEYAFKKITGRGSIYFYIARIAMNVYLVAVMLISAYITPRNFDVTHVEVPIKGLPAAFNNYRIVQISDIHLGSWNKKFDKLQPVIKLVNEQQPDIIIFSGDMVNNFGEEAVGWKPYFRKLKARYGMYAVLGNHDYGDYNDWKNDSMRTENRQSICRSITDFGFKLLQNEHIYLRSDSDSLTLVGLGNWSKSNLSNYSDLAKALQNTPPKAPKILIAHDPSQWEPEVIEHKDIALTLSGHTHAGQLGIKFGKHLFSPAAFVFKYWSGLYNVDNQYIYVNRGIGYIGLPMYIGVRPEITVIVLKAAPKVK